MWGTIYFCTRMIKTTSKFHDKIYQEEEYEESIFSRSSLCCHDRQYDGRNSVSSGNCGGCICLGQSGTGGRQKLGFYISQQHGAPGTGGQFGRI